MRIRSALILVFLLPTALHAQESIAPLADSLRASGDFRGAIEAYYAALELAGHSEDAAASLAYKIASTYALSGQYADSAFAYLDLALSSDESPSVLYDPDLYFLVGDSRWDDIKTRQLDRLAKREGADFNRDYAEILLSARMREWAYRWHIMFAYRTLGPESPILTALSSSMQEHHAQNETLILTALDEKGWPKLSAVGGEAAFAAGNVVTHAGLEARQEYLPMLEAACQAGEADWSDYAHILDRTELELGRPQVYGTQMEMNEETGSFEPQHMIEAARVDERRAAKGIEPIADQLARFNAAMKRDFGG